MLLLGANCPSMGRGPHFFSNSPISRAIRRTDPVCRPSEVAISDAGTRRRAIAASLLRSPSVHSFGFRDFISTSSSAAPGMTIGKFAGAVLAGYIPAEPSDRPHRGNPIASLPEKNVADGSKADRASHWDAISIDEDIETGLAPLAICQELTRFRWRAGSVQRKCDPRLNASPLSPGTARGTGLLHGSRQSGGAAHLRYPP